MVFFVLFVLVFTVVPVATVASWVSLQFNYEFFRTEYGVLSAVVALAFLRVGFDAR